MPNSQGRREFLEALERGLNFSRDCLLALALAELPERLLVTLAQLHETFLHLLALAESGRVQSAQDQVGDFGKSRNDDNHVVTAPGVLVNDGGRLPDPFGAADGSATEFHDDQAQ